MHISAQVPFGGLLTLTFLGFGICYTVPTITAIIVSFIKRPNMPELTWLKLLLFGAAIFGVTDHLWNGELFLIGKDIGKDIALGITITALTFVIWGVMIAVSRARKKVA